MEQIVCPDILKVSGIRYQLNPELRHKGAIETPEMCERTIQKLKWIDSQRPLCVLLPDAKNMDRNAVLVTIFGERVGYIDKNYAPIVRGMLNATSDCILVATIDSVNVYEHGFFFIRTPSVGNSFVPEEEGEDWSKWKSDEMLMLPDEMFTRCDSLIHLIRCVILPDLQNRGLAEIRQYFDLWLDAIRYNQCREVRQQMRNMQSALLSDARDEVKHIATEIRDLSSTMGGMEYLNDMVTQWWEPILQSDISQQSFKEIKLLYNNEKEGLLSLLDKVECLMRDMPHSLYRYVGDANVFFSHLNYLCPPKKALKGVLSLFALRTLICSEFNLSQDPFFGKRVIPAIDSDCQAALSTADLQKKLMDSINQINRMNMNVFNIGSVNNLFTGNINSVDARNMSECDKQEAAKDKPSDKTCEPQDVECEEVKEDPTPMLVQQPVSSESQQADVPKTAKGKVVGIVVTNKTFEVKVLSLLDELMAGKTNKDAATIIQGALSAAAIIKPTFLQFCNRYGTKVISERLFYKYIGLDKHSIPTENYAPIRDLFLNLR